MRPCRGARQSGSLSRFCDSGPTRTQFVRIASNNPNSPRRSLTFPRSPTPRRLRRPDLPPLARNLSTTDARQAVRPPLRIAERSKEGLRARRRKAGKEVLQVESQQHRFARVGRGKAHDRAPFHKSVNRRMDRYWLENTRENSPLQFLQARLRHFNQAHAARAFWTNAVVVMLHLPIAN